MRAQGILRWQRAAGLGPETEILGQDCCRGTGDHDDPANQNCTTPHGTARVVSQKYS